MLDLFLKLIEKLIDLVKQRQQLNRATFDELASPAMASMEAVHDDYVKTFSEYRAILKDKHIPLDDEHPVFDKIKVRLAHDDPRTTQAIYRRKPRRARAGRKVG